MLVEIIIIKGLNQHSREYEDNVYRFVRGHLWDTTDKERNFCIIHNCVMCYCAGDTPQELWDDIEAHRKMFDEGLDKFIDERSKS